MSEGIVGQLGHGMHAMARLGRARPAYLRWRTPRYPGQAGRAPVRRCRRDPRPRAGLALGLLPPSESTRSGDAARQRRVYQRVRPEPRGHASEPAILRRVNQSFIDSLFLVGGFSPTELPAPLLSHQRGRAGPADRVGRPVQRADSPLASPPTARGACRNGCSGPASRSSGCCSSTPSSSSTSSSCWLTLVIGLATFVWIRFYRFPPLIETYNRSCSVQRSLSQKKYVTRRLRPSAPAAPESQRPSRRRSARRAPGQATWTSCVSVPVSGDAPRRSARRAWPTRPSGVIHGHG